MYTPQNEKDLMFPVIHRKYIYFTSSKENCDLFMKDPMKYINQESYIPNLPIKLAIIGPPKSGKSKLAEELSREFGVKVVTPGQSLRYTLEEIPASALSIAIEEKLRSGAHVPSYLLVPSIEVATMVPRGATQGFVLDGFPNTEEESQLLENLGIIPYIFIILQYSNRTSEKNLKKLSANLYSCAAFMFLKVLPSSEVVAYGCVGALVFVGSVSPNVIHGLSVVFINNMCFDMFTVTVHLNSSGNTPSVIGLYVHIL
ncbi:adenylate kinase 9-like [Schistocerca cancellata]|uniref:adenylate kinase 9-like n=1 Tax=Schistocerca cancellata TaxID=274614 RepID=UPI0021188A17|nr:adenylate kinase 9-like [Schistocerca cancellata]